VTLISLLIILRILAVFVDCKARHDFDRDVLGLHTRARPTPVDPDSKTRHVATLKLHFKIFRRQHPPNRVLIKASGVIDFIEASTTTATCRPFHCHLAPPSPPLLIKQLTPQAQSFALPQLIYNSLRIGGALYRITRMSH
jgi:hypothetical protein